MELYTDGDGSFRCNAINVYQLLNCACQVVGWLWIEYPIKMANIFQMKMWINVEMHDKCFIWTNTKHKHTQTVSAIIIIPKWKLHHKYSKLHILFMHVEIYANFMNKCVDWIGECD